MQTTDRAASRRPVDLVTPSADAVAMIAVASRTAPWRLPPRAAAVPRIRSALASHGARWAAEGRVDEACLFRAILAPPAPSTWLKTRGLAPPLPETALLLRTAGGHRLAPPARADCGAAARAAGGAWVLNTEARIVRQIGPVDHARPGVFLFNFFHADDAPTVLEAWETTASWFVRNTGLDNSTVLAPEPDPGGGPAIINHCRWDGLLDIAPPMAFRPSFRREVLGAFDRAGVAAVPVLYRLAGRWTRPGADADGSRKAPAR